MRPVCEVEFEAWLAALLVAAGGLAVETTVICCWMGLAWGGSFVGIGRA